MVDTAVLPPPDYPACRHETFTVGPAPGGAHHERATRLLVDAAEESLGASPMTLAEVLVGPARAGKLDAARTAIREL